MLCFAVGMASLAAHSVEQQLWCEVQVRSLQIWRPGMAERELLGPLSSKSWPAQQATKLADPHHDGSGLLPHERLTLLKECETFGVSNARDLVPWVRRASHR